MATKMERVQTILSTLKDTPVTLAEARKVATAFGYTYRRGEVLTNAQEAGVVLWQLKLMIRQITRDANVSQAAVAAAAAAEATATVDLGADENE